MPLAEATAIAPAAHFELHDPAADEAALGELAGLCEQFSPLVGIQQPDTLCLDVTGLGPLFGGEESLAGQVTRAFHQWGFLVQVALADTLGAAWAAAHFGNRSPSLTLRVGVTKMRHATLTRSVSEGGGRRPIVVPPGQTVEALADLPVAALRLQSEVEILAELGIHWIGQLLRLPREALASRFDPQLLLRLDQATGAVSEIIVPHRPPPDITAETDLEYPIEDRHAVDIILGQLMERVSRVLAERQQGVIQLECRLEHEAGEATRVVVGLFRASAHAKHLLELTQMQLDRIALAALKKGTGTERQRKEQGATGSSLGASPLFQRSIRAVKLSVLTSAPLQAWQPELFEPSHREGRRQVAQLVDRLSNRLGREAVVRAVPRHEAQPEFAFRYEPLAGVLPGKSAASEGVRRLFRRKPSIAISAAAGRKMSQTSAGERSWKFLPRPLRLENEPIPLDVLSVVPEGPPIQFHLHGCHRVAQVWGPERIQTGWWRGRYVERDYYRIETATGIRFWLFRRLSDAKWFLHGVFD
jgi:protein ImuB